MERVNLHLQGALWCGAGPNPVEVRRNLSTDFNGPGVQVPSGWSEVTHGLFFLTVFSLSVFSKNSKR